jgi:hypothetical protein
METRTEPRSESSDLVQRKSAVSRPIAQRTQRTNGRSRATNDPLFLAHDHTGRRQARRRRDLVRMLIEGLGGWDAVSDLTLVTVRKAAELTVAAEAARAAVLNGGTCAADLDCLIKIEGEARRATRALGLKIETAKRAEAPPSPLWSPLRASLAKATSEST